MGKLGLVLVAVVVVGGSIAAALVWKNPSPDVLAHRIGFEIIRLLIQLLVIAVAGGWLLQEYNRRRDRNSAENEFRKSFLTRLVQPYANVKRSRLQLRAKARGEPPTQSTQDERSIAFDAYEKEMTVIGDAQLELEMLIRDADLFPTAFSDDRGTHIRAAIQGMENYLKGLLAEYRDSAHRARQLDGSLFFVAVPALSLFARSTAQGSNFRSAFSQEFYAAIQKIQEERLKL